MSIPYVVDARDDTGLYNARLGMWLFLASEVMLFGALLSAYLLLRVSAPDWPAGRDILNLPLGACNTVILVASSLLVRRAHRQLAAGSPGGFRVAMGVAVLLGAVFLGVKGLEWSQKLEHGLVPATSTFLAMYFTLTGLHALHVAGGLLVNAWMWGPGLALWRTSPRHAVQRVAMAGLYWHFVDLVWLVLFVLLYLT